MTARFMANSELAIDALAVARLTRLITVDTFPFGQLRDAVKAGAWAQYHEAHPTDDGEPTLVELLECPWCMSPYIATFVICARRIAPRMWNPLAKVLAASQIAGMAAVWVNEKSGG